MDAIQHRLSDSELSIATIEICNAARQLLAREPDIIAAFFDAYEIRKQDVINWESWPNGFFKAVSSVLTRTPLASNEIDLSVRSISQGCDLANAERKIIEAINHLSCHEPRVIEFVHKVCARLGISYVDLLRRNFEEYFEARYLTSSS